jgi:hypothetical protein
VGSGFPPAMLFGSGSSTTCAGKDVGTCSGGVDVRFLLNPDRAEARAGNFRFRSIFPLVPTHLNNVDLKPFKDASWNIRRNEEVSLNER